MTDRHKHKCYACGHIWEHERAEIQHCFDEAHTCVCGEVVREKYTGADEMRDQFNAIMAKLDKALEGIDA